MDGRGSLLRAQQPPKVFLNRRLSPRARTDLDQIWSFIATDNEHAADAVIELITQTFDLLTPNPGAGRRRPELSPTVRSFPVGSYLVFYGRGGSHSDCACAARAPGHYAQGYRALITPAPSRPPGRRDGSSRRGR
ncbi:type II toxin-antitoxin system RelE/ParE family toxin [Rhodopseudomonas palustris]|uniref:type II toxin-antitoxin system RelE/ParE family toxin n=1 Tax=Rhodopseudomonas palustris TaxID=1076 RepID=UPI0032DEF248